MPSNLKGHKEGSQPPFPPVWPGDSHSGHHASCGVRLRAFCTCGMKEWLTQQITQNPNNGRTAEMPVAIEFIQTLLNLPADVHITGIRVDYEGDSYRVQTLDSFDNIVFKLEAFADNTFPGPRVYLTTRIDSNNNLTPDSLTPDSLTPKLIFDHWESIN